MASAAPSRRLSLALAVTATILLAVTAGGWFISTGRMQPGVAPAGPAGIPSATSQGRPAGARAPGGTSPGPRVRGTARPGIPVRLTIDSPQGRRILSGPVDPVAASRTPDGSWAPINPPTRSHAVWVSQSALPAAPSTGTTAIYGHACIGYACVFNHAVDTPLGSAVTLETRRAVLGYRVISITQYPKAGARSLASRPNAADELILVTCAYRPDRTTVDNLVLVAALVTARNR